MSYSAVFYSTATHTDSSHKSPTGNAQFKLREGPDSEISGQEVGSSVVKAKSDMSKNQD